MFRLLTLPLLWIPAIAIPNVALAVVTQPVSPPLPPSHQAQPQECAPGLLGCPPRNRACHPDVIACPDRGSNRFDWLAQPIPYVVSPRRTQILEPQPILRWLPVPGARQYNVILQGEGLHWQVETTETAIQYNGDTPLIPGGNYQVIIEADTGESSLDEPDHLGGVSFELLTTQAQQDFRHQLQQLQADPATGPEAIANLYLTHGLLAAGITQLEALWQTQPTSARAIQLGNLYFEWLFLPTLAQPYYEQALTLSGDTPSLEQAVILTQLGHVRAVMHDAEGAIVYWRSAQAVYKTLGDAEQIEQLETYIEQEKALL
ncbi:MAG: hypothetical protein F6J87_22655 [Spirulina sp. SIO3F2]|nr:hypothetical protein [Spirulina sp. SIO3F2]